MTKITINKTELKALLNGTSKDNMRENLSGIYFDTKGLKAVTTNGHMLLSASIIIDGESIEPFILSPDSIKLALQAINQLGKFITIVEIQSCEGNLTCLGIPLHTIKAGFPDYSAVIPNINDRQSQIAISIEVLENMIKFAKDSKSNDKFIQFCFATGEKWNEKPFYMYHNMNIGIGMPARFTQIKNEQKECVNE